MASLIVIVLGDSNAGSGEFILSSDNTTNPQIYMLDRNTLATTPAKILCTEALLEDSARGNTSMIASSIGSTLALCKLLITRGKMPEGFDSVIIVGTAWAGTAFPNYWAVTGSRFALDGGAGLTYGFYAMVQAALALDSGNRIWFFDWIFGTNCSGDASYKSEAQAMFAEMRATLRTATEAPILVTSCPPDRANVLLGGATGLLTIISWQADCANWLPNSYYIDATGLTSELGLAQAFIHFNAAAHRGGTDNAGTVTSNYSSGTWYWDATVTYASGNHVLGSDNYCYNSKINGNINFDPVSDGEVHWLKTSYQYGLTFANPLSERKYTALMNTPATFNFSATW